MGDNATETLQTRFEATEPSGWGQNRSPDLEEDRIRVN